MSWGGLLLVLGGFVGYFVAVSRFALFVKVPWAFLVVMTAGLVLAAVGFARRPRVGSGVATALALGVAVFASWYLFSYSIFDRRETRPAVGDPFPAVAALPTSTGGTFRPADARGSYLLLLFYRGGW